MRRWAIKGLEICGLLQGRIYAFLNPRKDIPAIFSRFSAPYKLHLGCGKIKMSGWVNVDTDPNATAADFIWDLTKPLPFPSGCSSFIYHEHLLEHLPVQKAVAFLKDCRRLLIPGGVLRMATPSLDELIERAYRGTWREMDWLQWPQHRFVKTRAEMLNISFREWGHQWLYDGEELVRRMGEAGFMKVDMCAWGESRHPELRNRETRADSKLICEVSKD